MEYELRALEQLIATVLKPSNIKRETLDYQFLGECKELAKVEKERTRNRFRAMAFGKQKGLKAYYGKHQKILVQLCDMLYSYLQPGWEDSIHLLTNDEQVINFYKEILLIPENLLDFIEHHFPEYFDYACKAPECKRQLFAPDISRNLQLIKKELRKFKADGRLIEIVCSPLEDFLKPAEPISYGQLAYFRQFQKELILFFKIRHEENIVEALCRRLLAVNFNSVRFFSYYIAQLKERAAPYTSLPNLIEFFSRELKMINQVVVTPGLAYIDDYPTIREQIAGWIAEELYYQEKKRKLLWPASTNEPAEPDELTKVHTSLSVAQLAMAVKLLIDAKLITNKNAAEVMRLVAGSFRTDRQEVISEESLRNKSYSFEKTTVDRLKDVVVELLNLVRKY